MSRDDFESLDSTDSDDPFSPEITDDTDSSDDSSEPTDLDIALYQQRQQGAVEPVAYSPAEEQRPQTPVPQAQPEQMMTPGTPQAEAPKPKLAPEALLVLGPRIMDAPSYEEGMAQLKNVYEKNDWEDKQAAADNFASVSENLNRLYKKQPEVKLDGASSVTLSQQMLDKNLDQDAKIGLIEDWRTTQKKKLFEGPADSLVGAKRNEQVIDQYATDLRRHVVSGDVGRIPDMISRGAEAALSPIMGTVDALAGTELRKGTHDVLEGHQNPDLDNSVTGKIGSAVGSVAGFAASSVNPVSALGYLGATLVDQGKQVYDQAYEATGSHDAAGQALLESAPGITIGAFADKLVGGTMGKLLKGEPGMINALSGAVSGAAGNAVQAVSTGMALADATANKDFLATGESVAEEALVGGTLGGLIGGAAELKSRALARAKRGEVSTETDKVRAQVAKAQGVVEIPDQPGVASPIGQFVQKPNESAGDVAAFEDGAEPLADQSLENLGEKLTTPPPGGFKPPPGAAEDAIQPMMPNTAAPAPAKLLPINTGIPGPFMNELVRQVDGEIGLANLDPSLYGFYDPSNHLIRINRNVFKDIDQAYSTFAHEIGHMVDFYGRKEEIQNQIAVDPDPATEPVLHKLVRMNDVLRKSMDTDAVAAEARDLSKTWRPGWDGSPVPAEWVANPPAKGTPEAQQHQWLDYRNGTTEIQADAFSAIMNDPAMVQAQYPAIWDAFQRGLDSQPKVKDFWNSAVAVAKDPVKLKEWTESRAEAGRMKQADIAIKSAEQRIAESKGGWKRDISAAGKSIRHRLLDRAGVLQDVAKSFPEGSAEREQAFKNLNDYYASLGQKAKVGVLFDGPLNTMISKEWDTLGISPVGDDQLGTWKNYENWNRIKNETTEAMDNIKSSPGTYHKAYADIYDTLEANVGTQFKENPLSSLGRDLSGFKGIELSDQLAKTHLRLPAEVREKLFNQMVKKGNFEAAELLASDTFNVRRYMGNPNADRLTAESNLSVMEQQLGPDTFKQLQDFSKKFHKIIAEPLHRSVRESGLFSDSMISRMQRNQDNWVNFNVLKYFEKDPYFNGVIKAQVGTISEIGDEVASTTAKTKAIFALSEYQKGQNAAVSTARMAGHTVKAVDQQLQLKKNFKIGKRSLFEMKEELQTKNPEKSYLVEYEKGTPTLYEIDSPDYAKLFEKSVMEKSPLLSVVMRFTEGYNKILGERETKTVVNPVFMARQRFNDVTKEAIVANSKELPGTWFHTDRYLSANDKKGNTDARLLMEGVFNPETQFMFDQNALAVQYVEEAGGADLHTSVEDMVYSKMGKRVPGEESLSTPVKINKLLNKAMEKTWVLKKVKQKAEKDEARAKINMFRIAKERLGMGEHEAAAFARSYAGTPDPLGGGTEARSLSKLFLFGRAHANGMRTEYELMQRDPKNYMMQYAYRKGIPRMMVSSAIMGPLVGALFGDEEEQLTRKFLDKIATFDKDTKMIIPLGFTDGEGKYVGFNIKSSDISPDHKAVYGRLPYSRELVNLEQAFSPGFKALEDYLSTGTISAKQIGQNVAQSVSTVFGAQVAPGIQGAARTTMLALGYNPYDLFRNKGILTKDVQEAGSFLERSYEYLTWSAFNWNPGLFAYKGDKVSSTDQMTPFDMISSIPVAGAFTKGFVGNSNYGDYEAGMKSETMRKQKDAEIRMDMGPATKRLYNEYIKSQSMVTKLGKGWEQHVTPEEVNKVHALNNWHSRAYKHGFNEARAFFESGDSENMTSIYKSLDESSEAYLKMLGR